MFENDFGLDRPLDPEEERGLADTKTDYDVEDRGTWMVVTVGNRIGLLSSDSKHDVVLYMTGDFGSVKEHTEYAAKIAERLNRTIPD